MLFNLESDSIYESEMIKVKSHGINDMFVAKNSKRFFIRTHYLKCVNYIYCAYIRSIIIICRRIDKI